MDIVPPRPRGRPDPDAIAIRTRILEASHASGQGHIPTSFSVVEILQAVYSVIRHDPARPDWPERDLFVLSKGHAALALYAVLAHQGYLPTREVDAMGRFMAPLGCHPDRLKVPGVEVSTGSLGHGITIAVGFALAIKLQKSRRRVVVLIGDGESNEGTVWEALMVASSLDLSNLTVIVDDNQSQRRSLQIENFPERLRAFGWDPLEVDGHDPEALRGTLERSAGARRAIVARTVKGYGCETLVNNRYEWHRKSPTAEQLPALLEELRASAV